MGEQLLVSTANSNRPASYLFEKDRQEAKERRGEKKVRRTSPEEILHKKKCKRRLGNKHREARERRHESKKRKLKRNGGRSLSQSTGGRGNLFRKCIRDSITKKLLQTGMEENDGKVPVILLQTEYGARGKQVHIVNFLLWKSCEKQVNHSFYSLSAELRQT